MDSRLLYGIQMPVRGWMATSRAQKKSRSPEAAFPLRPPPLQARELTADDSGHKNKTSREQRVTGWFWNYAAVYLKGMRLAIQVISLPTIT
jgi:hypothetical protein